MEKNNLRQKIDQLIDSDEVIAAHALLAQLWRQGVDPAIASYVIDRFEKLRSKLAPVSCRIAILRSFTLEPVVPLLRASAAINGIELIVHVGDFNAYAQEILDPTSSLYRFVPDNVFLAVQTRDIAPDLWKDFADLSQSEVTAAINRVKNSFQDLIEAFRLYSQAHLVLHTLEMPFIPSNGILDGQLAVGQVEAIQQINRELHRLAQKQSGVYVLDYNALIAYHGWMAWYDESKWLTMRMPITANCLGYLANAWLHFIYPLIGKTCKALVVDLDNTLWGGVIGEDGLDGIRLGTEYPGAHYLALQRVILDLYQRGVILAICSKNNLDDAMDALEHHPDMLLRLNHFAAFHINWTDKVQNLREIADELNIGLNTIAFLDDNPVERQWVRSQLPEVTVIDLPSNPAQYANTLRESPVFERLDLSEEDRRRGHYYAQQRQRKEAKRNIASLEDFLRSLQMKVDISLMTPTTLGRVAQLTQKTNQFNLTTRRYTEQQIENMAIDLNHRVYTVQVRDKFGDNGLVGVIITQREGRLCKIDTFLLSCRVIGRTIETAMLATIVEQARIQNIQRLVGFFLPTKKNLPVQDFYRSHRFVCVSNQAEQSQWEYDLNQEQIKSPPWIKLNVLLEEMN